MSVFRLTWPFGQPLCQRGLSSLDFPLQFYLVSFLAVGILMCFQVRHEGGTYELLARKP